MEQNKQKFVARVLYPISVDAVMHYCITSYASRSLLFLKVTIS